MSAREGYFPPEADIATWIIQQGLSGSDLAELLEGIAERLIKAGIPLCRAFVGMPVISPDLRGLSFVWSRSEGLSRHELRHEDADDFTGTPVYAMLQSGETFRRWRLDAGPTGFPMLDGFATGGASDHVSYLVSFDRKEAAALRGAAISFTTDRPGGFSDFDIERLSRFTPLIGLTACRFALSSLVTDVLDAYVGQDAGRRILQGEIRRGEGHQVRAALLFADLRSFTSATERDGTGIVRRLGHHLSAIAEPIHQSGGEVLKFLGDGLLAGWPADDLGDADACAAALGAACEGVRRNADVPGGPDGEGPLGLDVSLHLGEVFYGNIGAGGRLDFTVIGPAVNEASRIEGLCGSLGHPILMSGEFAALCGRPTRSLGHHPLRNVARPCEVFALA